jgi:hypothetical protein
MTTLGYAMVAVVLAICYTFVFSVGFWAGRRFERSERERT